MGGFAGGDEGGYWEVGEPYGTHKPKKIANKLEIQINDLEYSIKSYAKTDISLENYIEKDNKNILKARFKRLNNIYDTISFVPCKCKSFTIEGCENIPLESNSIFKVYKELIDFTGDSDIEDFFLKHKVVVKKEIKVNKGFGGASSNAAYFLHLCKEIFSLVLSNDELLKIGQNMKIDFTFFVYNYELANISAIGDDIKVLEE